VSEILLIVGVVVVALTIASLKRPGFAIAFLWGTYGLEQLLQSQVVLFVIYPFLANVAPACVCVFAVAMRLGRGQRMLWYDPVSLLVLLLFLLASASFLWSISERDTIEQLARLAPYLIAFCVIGPLCINNLEDMNDAFNGFLVLSTPVLAGLAVAPMRGQGIILIGGSLGNPLTIGSFGAYAAILGFITSFGEKRIVLRVAKIAVAILGAYVCLRSGSRGQMIACVLCAGAGAYYVMSGIKHQQLLKPLAIFAVLIIAAIYAVQEWGIGEFGYSYRWNAEEMIDAMRRGRLETAGRLLEYFAAQSPVQWAIGLGSSASYKVVGFYCHMVPPEVLCELGLVGFAIYGMICWRSYHAARGLISEDQLGFMARRTVAALLCLLAFEAILQLKQGSLLSSYMFFTATIMVGRVGHSLRYAASRIANSELRASHYRVPLRTANRLA
jgi:hypothetical protein